MARLTRLAPLIAAATPQIGFRRTAGIAYGEGPRGRLDLYRPVEEPEDAPVVVFLHGGGWEDGSRQLYRFIGATLSRRGLVTVIPDYRLHPHAGFPAFLEDNARAVAWARTNLRQGGRPMFLMGHSAGAYNAAMLGLDGRWLGAAGLDPAQDLAGVIGLAGPYDFLPLTSATLRTIFGPDEIHPSTQPINHVHGRAPPFLLLTGEKDGTVSAGNSVRLAERLNAAGGSAELVVYPELGHIDIAGAVWPWGRPKADVTERIMAFVRRHAAG